MHLPLFVPGRHEGDNPEYRPHAYEELKLYKHVLIPTDGTDCTARAITAGIQIAKAFDARVTGIYVGRATYISLLDSDVDFVAESALAMIGAEAKKACVRYDLINIREESVADGLVKYAENHACDLIVMGTHGRSRVGKFILGSVAASVLSECKVPTLIYR